MKLAEAFENHLPLKVIISKDHERVIAEGFIVGEGIVFYDVFWYEASFHPIHLIEGEISGEGPWRVGEMVIEEMKEDEFLFEADWKSWLRFRNHEDGKEATRELAQRLMKQEFEDLSYVDNDG